jgi:hypothetical protein
MAIVAKDKAFRLALIEAAGRVYSAAFARSQGFPMEHREYAREFTSDFLKMMSEEVLHDND